MARRMDSMYLLTKRGRKRMNRIGKMEGLVISSHKNGKKMAQGTAKGGSISKIRLGIAV